MAKRADAIAKFLASYPSPVEELALALRSMILSAIPGVTETLDQPARIVGYSIGAGYAGSVCTIIPSKNGVKLGIVNGADFANPHGLMEGSGKRHRYVQFSTRSDLERAGLKELLASAKAMAASRVAKRS